MFDAVIFIFVDLQTHIQPVTLRLYFVKRFVHVGVFDKELGS